MDFKVKSSNFHDFPSQTMEDKKKIVPLPSLKGVLCILQNTETSRSSLVSISLPI